MEKLSFVAGMATMSGIVCITKGVKDMAAAAKPDPKASTNLHALKTKMEGPAASLKNVDGNPDLRIELSNDSGHVKLGQLFEIHPGNVPYNVDIKIKNGSGVLDLRPGRSNSWSVASGCITGITIGGMAFYYRNELRIIGRGVWAMLNLAIADWEKKQKKEKKKNKKRERGARRFRYPGILPSSGEEEYTTDSFDTPSDNS